MTLLIKNGLVWSEQEFRALNLLLDDHGCIQSLHLPSEQVEAGQVLDARQMLVVPGFVQAHVHFNQTLFRGLADDMDVVEWLRTRIWPLEQLHTPETIRAAAKLAIAELIRGGTTTAVVMESANFTDMAFEVAAEMGMRVVMGNAMMDCLEEDTGIQADSTEVTLRKSLELKSKFDHAENGRLRYAFCPRGTSNVSRELWKEIGRLSSAEGTVVHTHVAENGTQARQFLASGRSEIDYLAELGVVNQNLLIAHGVWLRPKDMSQLSWAGASVAHCPSANMKLASGFAPIPELLEWGINVAIGADGAPCNNTLDAFHEMRLAALIHKPKFGPRAMPAEKVFAMMTTGGARAAGLEDQIGSLEPGKKADLVLIRREKLHAWPPVCGNEVGQIVYAHRAEDVDTVIIDGRVLLQGGEFTAWDLEDIFTEVQKAQTNILERFEKASVT
jgi:cytosine/adenosine deaminase-related metal-dependent hydrolase